ncbi:hypothetical protein CYLTODRAFT_13437 [Cylindrobasidium torrendii FP15055 ss-10]|uniref:Uncharacterized protein n=1 Tax=Cylindrobasidium torrendii FP15055 ss-10 TaxID=1314674 RepID=A0A0D7B983_9AGAR|nr:hypothetical protein CYLTODRAFT_13437 [Cylindrobasidium torrendii FP15055 ss-10]
MVVVVRHSGYSIWAMLSHSTVYWERTSTGSFKHESCSCNFRYYSTQLDPAASPDADSSDARQIRRTLWSRIIIVFPLLLPPSVPMGAKRYWEMLSNGYGVDVESIKLPTYATRGFLENSGNVRAIRMAIDARGVLHRAGYAGGKFSSTIADRGCLFNIICAFRSIPMLSLFVFDGASRRGVKRGRRVTGNPHNLEESMQDLLDAFGMEWARPDGEADREFSFILKYGMADCVLTDDNDALPHGITHVYRPAVNVTGQKTSSIHKFLNGVLYTTNASKSISDHIFVSICLGSDGDTGLSGVGPALVEILCAFQHHDTLIQCAQYTPENFESARAVFLAAMRSSCMAHSSGRVRAITFPASFPSKTIIQRYLVNPPGDSTGQHQSQSPDYSTPPCLPRISHWMAGNLTGCRNMKTLYHRASWDTTTTSRTSRHLRITLR